jgi:hypothetical protein
MALSEASASVANSGELRFVQNDIPRLKLNRRLKECAEEIRYYLEQHVSDDDKPFFAAGLLHSISDVLSTAADRKLLIELVAQAIDRGAGKKDIAAELRNNAGTEMSISTNANIERPRIFVERPELAQLYEFVVSHANSQPVIVIGSGGGVPGGTGKTTLASALAANLYDNKLFSGIHFKDRVTRFRSFDRETTR